MDDDVLLDDGRVYADVLRDLAARLREAFMAQYTGDERMFALSLASGRPEDCALCIAFNGGGADAGLCGDASGCVWYRGIILILRFLVTVPTILSLLSLISLTTQITGLIWRKIAPPQLIINNPVESRISIW